MHTSLSSPPTFLLLFTILTTLPSTVFSKKSYPIQHTDTLNCRTGPGTSYPIFLTYDVKKTPEVTIKCQTYGTNIEGNNVWDKTQNDCFVSDYYVKTGSNGLVAKLCKGTSKETACEDVNDKTIALIKEFEGLRTEPYLDPVGLPTIGYGHLCQEPDCKEVNPPLTEASATALLLKDLKSFTACISENVNDRVKLNDNQYGALVSWAFNVGCGAISTSTLMTRLNNGEDPNKVAAEELPRWVYGGGEVLPGLVRRRNAEVELFKASSKKEAHPKCEKK